MALKSLKGSDVFLIQNCPEMESGTDCRCMEVYGRNTALCFHDHLAALDQWFAEWDVGTSQRSLRGFQRDPKKKTKPKSYFFTIISS